MECKHAEVGDKGAFVAPYTELTKLYAAVQHTASRGVSQCYLLPISDGGCCPMVASD